MLALRSLLSSVLHRTGLAEPAARMTGAVAPVRALAVAGAAQRLRDGVVLFVVPGDADIDTAVGDVRFFLGALEVVRLFVNAHIKAAGSSKLKVERMGSFPMSFELGALSLFLPWLTA